MHKPTALIQARLDLGLTQIEAANAVKLTRQRYGNIEKSKAGIKLPRAESIALCLEAKIEQLFRKDEKSNRYFAKKFEE
ncbi:MAG: helix-turn-helix domain-containing protein [Bacteriovorax sp.]|nr:helix-turn-helix domain-containing protein [Bacteriovorax sp.]